MAQTIHETVIITQAPAQNDAGPHIVPMGVRWEGKHALRLAPFRPSTTLDNLQASGQATLNATTDVRVIAGCLTGRHRWPTQASEHVAPPRLAAALTHYEVQVDHISDDETRPEVRAHVVHHQTHAPFAGMNRAQAAVLEAAILVSRIAWLPAEKVCSEVDYLLIAMNKTAGDAEREAWEWLMEPVRERHGAHLGQLEARS